MLRRRVHGSYRQEASSSLFFVPSAIRSEALLLGGGVATGAASFSSPLSSSSSVLVNQKRHSVRHTTKAQLKEMSQPEWIHQKRHGVFSYDRAIGANKRTANSSFVPLETTHMNLWASDTDASNNRFFRSYTGLQEHYHNLLGRPHYSETEHSDRRLGLSNYELHNDQRFHGIDRPAFTNGHYESGWNTLLYRHGAQGSVLNNPRSELTAQVLGDELLQLRDFRNKDDCKAWWDRLNHLIQVHHKSVGDIGDYASRNVQVVHRFFVTFHDAISAFEFQDKYLAEHLTATRPSELSDVFAIFLEMEANYVSFDHCPRCSLPLATTRFCGEGDEQTPFRQHRGRWAPHQTWGKEWLDVVARRAEALWYRAVEDEYFGGAHHTQRQAEALMNVYLKTKQRGKAVSFMANLRGSKEFITGRVTVTAALQHTFDQLLDSTPHPHLPTNAFQTESGSAVYLAGDVNRVPLSPQQFRLDMELNKFRRAQKEEGVVRLPPKDWSIDLSAIVPYKLENGRVTNWRDVKAGIEKSFQSSGLMPDSYTKDEWREMYYLTDAISRQDALRATAETQLETEKAKLGSNGVVFPDATWYRCFDKSDKSIQSIVPGLTHGAAVRGLQRTFFNPKSTTVTTGANQTLVLDVSEETLKTFALAHGDVITISGGPDNLINVPVIVLGVEIGGSNNRELIAALVDDHDTHVPLGKEILEMRGRWSRIQRTGSSAAVGYMPLRGEEEYEGVVVGVRNGELYCQWGQNVATPVRATMSVHAVQGVAKKPLQEPFSWATPFRNNWNEERLQELQRAPWNRERWVSLIPGKFTPKAKKFGYSQHTTQDDFVTKEYKDRLVSRQFFHSPNSFAVIPEATATSVNFGPKQSYVRYHGLPTVDRNELENGWGAATVMSDFEMRDIEQCIRDISGNRPGNFVKSQTETASVSVNEPWWKPLEFGWEQHNREQNLLDSSERKLKDSATLPFGGKIPPFGTTYGMGERIRGIAEDFGKGFGLGPHQMSPTSDKANFNTLGSEHLRARFLGYGNLLVRLFNDKLGTDDLGQVILSQCSAPGQEQDVKQLMQSVNEWRDHGRPPSSTLRKFLSRYLAEEIDAYNVGLPSGVEKLSLDVNPAVLTPTVDNIWSSTDKVEYALNALQVRGAQLDGEHGLIPSIVLKYRLAELKSLDPMFVQHVQNSCIQELFQSLSKEANRGIDEKHLLRAIGERSSAGKDNRNARAAQATPMLSSVVLDAILLRFGVAIEERKSLLYLLSRNPEVGASDHTQFIVPLSVVMTWKPDSATIAALSQRKGGSGNHYKSNVSAAQTNAAVQTTALTNTMSLDAVLQNLPALHDGLAMDVQYAIREHSNNAVMRKEFDIAWSGFSVATAASGSAAGGSRGASSTASFDKYVTGKFVPNAEVAAQLFCDFLRRASTSRALLEEYFVLDHSGKAIDVRLAPRNAEDAEAMRTFTFDNVRSDVRNSDSQFKESQVIDYFARAQRPVYLAAHDKITYAVGGSQHLPNIIWAPLADSLQPLAKGLEVLRPHLDKSGAVFSIICSHPDTTGMICLEHFIRRTMPCLGYFNKVLDQYVNATSSQHTKASHNFQTLANILQNERNFAIETEFRRNAERYWKQVLDGRGLEENAASGGRGGRGGRGGSQLGRGGNRRPDANVVSFGAATRGPSSSSATGSRVPAGASQQQQQQRGTSQSSAGGRGSLDRVLQGSSRGGRGAGGGRGASGGRAAGLRPSTSQPSRGK
ncbi:Hypothetical protein, putative [Bodo saltans]|uniref:Uncharacterized protein n=1 Tax=Bodo saltans TaxID=75058 RepID=A0A0S4JFK2_BODSA|nr:Hypothetical protein, putative [Bodo saltans]|eukprot:CUG88951.1 Hypothetical protein, putative [Bodo saltans]